MSMTRKSLVLTAVIVASIALMGAGYGAAFARR